MTVTRSWGDAFPKLVEARPEREHRIGSYNKGCRCDDCRRAARVARAKYRARAKGRAA